VTVGTLMKIERDIDQERSLAWALYNVKMKNRVSPVAGSFILFF